MTQKEFATLGGHARAKKLSIQRRKEIARNAGLISANKRKRSKKIDVDLQASSVTATA